MERQVGHVGHVAGHADQLVALLVHEELALGALESLPAEAPDAVVTVRAVRSLEMRGGGKLFAEKKTIIEDEMTNESDEGGRGGLNLRNGISLL